MKCPACDVELGLEGYFGEGVDYCLKCRRVWLNQERIFAYCDNAGKPRSHAEKFRMGPVFLDPRFEQRD